MAPRIPLPTDELTFLGTPDASTLAPELSAPIGQFYKESVRLKELDPVTTELVRIRNAKYQECFL